MRPENLNPLFAEITSIKGMGAALEKPLARLNIERVKDALYHLPSGWLKRNMVDNLDQAKEGDYIIIRLVASDYRSTSQRRGPFRVYANDRTGNAIQLVYFGGNSGWARKQWPLGEPRIASGRLDIYGDGWQIVHPDHVLEEHQLDEIAEREAIYPLAQGLSQKRIASLTAEAMMRMPDLAEWIEPSLLAQRQWPGWSAALKLLHHGPTKDSDTDGLSRARQRLSYDEVFANQLAFAVLRQSNRTKKGQPIQGDGALRNRLALPFALTNAQQRSIGEILGDMAQGVPMLRLLQGDVGSGKTVVALLAMLATIETGAQAALLAPTEILARQHFQSLRKMLATLPIEIALLTGRDKGKLREASLMGLADGSIQLVIGTHALFQESVRYRNLALTIIDEQHKFGVSQRLMLQNKGKITPHLLAMTATPIPRTLTLSQYGEMEVSRLDELPPGRQPIETRVVSDARLQEVIPALTRHMHAGKQAYWVCPLVSESETSDLAAAEMRAKMLSAKLGAKNVALVHGQMPGEQKDAMMENFVSGRSKLLVATTVIEVGVDVPNATLIIIEAAERFGLAQLHQLRGRVGRGEEQSICLLLRGSGLSETGAKRLAMMRESNDGFYLAEADLKLRGGGELLGTRQSGEASFRVADPQAVQEMTRIADDDARLLLDRDGGLESERGQAARHLLYLFERDHGVRLLGGG